VRNTELQLKRKDIVYLTLSVSRGGRRSFQMGQSQCHLGSPFGELADYRKIHGHCNVPKGTAKIKLALWVSPVKVLRFAPTRRKVAVYDAFTISALEKLRFQNGQARPGWERPELSRKRNIQLRNKRRTV
jgi:hypothetical protein